MRVRSFLAALFFCAQRGQNPRRAGCIIRLTGEGKRMVVYLDAVFAENLIVDYLLLRVSARLTGVPRHRLRFLLAAILGGAYAVALWFPAGWIGHPVIRVAVGILMCVIGAGRNRRTVKAALVFFLLAAALAGTVLALESVTGGTVRLYNGVVCLNVPLPLLGAAVAAVYLAVTLAGNALHRTANTAKRIHTVTVWVGERCATFPVLADTGCLVRDPVSGCPVMLTDAAVLASLMPATAAGAFRRGKDAAEVIRCGGASEPHLRPVFCHSLHGREDMLAAFRPDRLTVDGEARDFLLAAVPDGPDGSDGFRAVAAAEALE